MILLLASWSFFLTTIRHVTRASLRGLSFAAFGQVFLVQDITTFVSNKDVADDKGWALVGGFVVIYSM
jgi:hypothetical protein